MSQEVLIKIEKRLDSIESKMATRDELQSVKDSMVTRDEFSVSMDKMVTRDEFNTSMDEVLIIVRRLDQERVFTLEWVRRIESDLERVKQHLHLI